MNTNAAQVYKKQGTNHQLLTSVNHSFYRTIPHRLPEDFQFKIFTPDFNGITMNK